MFSYRPILAVTLVLALAATLAPASLLAGTPEARAAIRHFDPSAYGQWVVKSKADQILDALQKIDWNLFREKQSEQVQLDYERSKTVEFVRMEPLSSLTQGTVAELQPEHYPSVQFASARWRTPR